MFIFFLVLAIFLFSANSGTKEPPRVTTIVSSAGTTAPNFNGTKRAVLIGIDYVGLNYAGSSLRLQGCINDVENIQSRLLVWGWSTENIVMVKETAATLTNIRQKLLELKQQTIAGDISFVWFSGHGTQFGEKECWFTYDRLLMTDVELNTWIASFEVPAFVFVGSDSCNSGTILDLEFQINATRTLNLLPRSVRSSFSSLSQRSNARNFVLHEGDFLEGGRSIALLIERLPDQTPLVAYAIVFSGCTDTGLSAEIFSTVPQGAMTLAFLNATQNTSLTFFELLLATRTSLQYLNQVPQLSFSRLFDVDVRSIGSFGFRSP